LSDSRPPRSTAPRQTSGECHVNRSERWDRERSNCNDEMKRFFRVLSTGRVGTKFLTEVLVNQGHAAFHEEIYSGEPSCAIIEYMKFLASMWRSEPDTYFDHDSDYGEFYTRSVRYSFELCRRNPGRFEGTRRSLLRRLHDRVWHKPCNFILDAQNRLTPATPILDRYLKKAGIDTGYVILLRNPIKTIHAIYVVESTTGYDHRSPLFSRGERTPIGAAWIWRNTYEMIHDQRNRLGAGRFFVVELESLNRCSNRAAELFQFLGVPFHAERFEAYRDRVVSKPLRADKYSSERNSDLFRAPEFVFSAAEIDEIMDIVRPMASVFHIDLAEARESYSRFHDEEKKKLGFS
jgi:hypothetical protein